MDKILEVVIKIPKGDYDYIMHRANAVDEDLDYHETLISYGTVLPKGHGRLVDEKDLSLMTVHLIDGIFVCTAPTIIEADREVENDR